MNISTTQKKSPAVLQFESEEWRLADIEHYGKPRNFEKRKVSFVAENDRGEVMGVLDLVLEANVAFLENLLVGHSFRKKGVGRQLLSQAETYAKKQGCTKIWTETDEDWSAFKFYPKMGFVVCGVHEKHYLGKTAVILEKFFEEDS